MNLFGIEIRRTYIIDFFPDVAMRDALDTFLQQDTIVNVLVPETRQEVFHFFETIENEIRDQGCLIHLLGHGGQGKTGFWREDMIIHYSEMIAPFSRLNEACNGKLIVNASLMCFTDPFQSLFDQHPEIFHAGIYSSEKRSAQALKQMFNIYKKCRIGVETHVAVEQENDAISDAHESEFRPFGYAF